MSMTWTLALFYILVNDVLVQALTSSPGTEGSISPRQYRYTDPDTGTQFVCDKCPAGTYVSSHCTNSSMRECMECPAGTFTRGENGVQQCHRCRSRCLPPFVEKSPCTATSDRVCVCPPGECSPLPECLPGWGVRKSEDVRCRRCPRGTFSSVPSRAHRCQTHTDCQALGMLLLTKGTDKTDNVCGPSAPDPISTSSHSTDPAPGATIVELTNPQTHSMAEITTPTSPSDVAEFLNSPTPDPLPTWNLLPANQQALPERKNQGLSYRPIRRGSPRPSMHKHFDINEHLPWMIVLLLLLFLVVIVVCSVKRSSRVLKKGPRQDPSSIVEKAIHKKPSSPAGHNKEKWIYYSNGQGVDILKLVAAQIGCQWIDMYQSLANANEREVAAFSKGYPADHERAYAALQHWTICDSDANLAKLINALHQQRRIDVVEKIRGVMEDNPQFDLNQLMISVNVNQGTSPNHKPLDAQGLVVEHSPLDRTKGFFTDESEPLLRCDSTSSKDSALSRTGSFITKEKKDTVLRQVRLDPCDLQPIFDDMLHILNPEELHVIEEISMAEDKLDRLFEIAGVKSQEASQTLLDSVYSHLPDLL
ncbi:tumor necrosis factor receptor superfamily member 21 isoform X1 [Tachysurus fulvidraco]|uniref:tumor necrosis factor receptor superfamily member 21 isoform X1 n=2 Tax=Tachysurus fulvidraco TaxID=1234273 RepID=UPI000F4FFEC7|nr:tumor necrosis factor receptor superfamily member 21 isoform X1 [Tachysurus fulvidraco]